MNLRHMSLALALIIAFSYMIFPGITLAGNENRIIARIENPGIEDLVKAPSALLIDLKTGETLWQKHPDEERPIASTTKMMTAIIALEMGNLNDTVTVQKDVLAAGAQGGIGLAPGEQLKLRDLMYALLLYSANDAAVAIADHVGGSVDKFVSSMNDKAILLNAAHTNFVTPHGLDNKKHYSTARDLSRIARYGLNNKIFSDIVATKRWKLKRANRNTISLVENRNELLVSYKGAIGVKTGHTLKAGYCLVSSAKRNGISLLSVILDAKTQQTVFKQSSTLLDYGFSLYEKRDLIRKGVIYENIQSKFKQRISLTVDRNISAIVRTSKKSKLIMWSENNADAPISKGTCLGKIAVILDGKVIATANLVSISAIKKPSYSQIARFYWSSLLDFIF